MTSDCGSVPSDHDILGSTSFSLSLPTIGSLDCSELFCHDESFSPAGSGRGDRFVSESAAWPSTMSSAPCAVSLQSAVSILPSPHSICEMIRQELVAEQEVISEGCCCQAGERGAQPPCIWAEHRRVLCEWMLALCRAARMTRETFCLAASLLDRYVAECCAAMGDRGYPGESTLQLLAMACLSLAMKYEEVAPLHSADLLRLAVDPATGALLYTAGDLGRMEWLVMQMVSWRVRAPTPASFLMLLLPACGVNTSAASSLSEAPSDGSVPVLVQLATCLLDLCVLRAPELPFQPSTTAVACLLLAERLSGASETMAQRMLQLLWCSLFPNAHQQQHQRLLLGQCLLAAEALWIAAHGGAVRRPMHTAQASSCGRPPAGSPAACTSSRAPPAHPSCPPHDMLATPVDPHACAREDNVSLIQRQYLVWAQEQHCCDAIVMPPTKSPAAVLSW